MRGGWTPPDQNLTKRYKCAGFSLGLWPALEIGEWDWWKWKFWYLCQSPMSLTSKAMGGSDEESKRRLFSSLERREGCVGVVLRGADSEGGEGGVWQAGGGGGGRACGQGGRQRQGWQAGLEKRCAGNSGWEKSPYAQKLSFIYLVLLLGAETFLGRRDDKETLLLSITFENITQQVLFCCEDWQCRWEMEPLDLWPMTPFVTPPGTPCWYNIIWCVGRYIM